MTVLYILNSLVCLEELESPCHKVKVYSARLSGQHAWVNLNLLVGEMYEI